MTVTARVWNDETMTAAVAKLAGTSGRFPARKEFVEAGLVGLYLKLQRRGDEYKKQVADRLNLTGHQTRNKHQASVWSEETVRERILRIAEDNTDFPTREQFHMAGETELYAYLLSMNSRSIWAERLNLRDPNLPRWTDDRIETALRNLIGTSGLFPTSSQFEKAGLGGLETHLRKSQTKAEWASKLNATTARLGRKHQWTDARIESTLKNLIGTSGLFPTRPEFEAAGLSSLNSHLRTTRTVAAWAEKMNVPVPRRGRKRYWTDARIEATLKNLIGASDQFPSCTEFKQAGLENLYTRISAEKSQAQWAEKLGVAYTRYGRRSNM